MHEADGKRGRGRWARNKQTAQYLNITPMSLWRWKRNPRLGFPQAAVINDIEYNDLDQVDAWMRARTRLVADEEVA